MENRGHSRFVQDPCANQVVGQVLGVAITSGASSLAPNGSSIAIVPRPSATKPSPVLQVPILVGTLPKPITSSSSLNAPQSHPKSIKALHVAKFVPLLLKCIGLYMCLADHVDNSYSCLPNWLLSSLVSSLASSLGSDCFPNCLVNTLVGVSLEDHHPRLIFFWFF